MVSLCLCILFFIIIFILIYIDVTTPCLKYLIPIEVSEYDLHSLYDMTNYTDSVNIYYINVEDHSDRNIRFCERLPTYVIPIRIDAVTPSTMPTIKKNLKSMFNTDLELACFCSHLKAIYTAYMNNEEYAIIMEDDAIIVQDINWNRLTQLAPPDWEILQMHVCCLMNTTENHHDVYNYSNTNNLWLRSAESASIPSAAAYVISRKGMEKLITRFIKRDLDTDKLCTNDILSTDLSIDLRNEGASCQADVILYNHLTRYICTQMIVNVENIDSTLGHGWFQSEFNGTDKYIQKNLKNYKPL